MISVAIEIVKKYPRHPKEIQTAAIPAARIVFRFSRFRRDTLATLGEGGEGIANPTIFN